MIKQWNKMSFALIWTKPAAYDMILAGRVIWFVNTAGRLENHGPLDQNYLVDTDEARV